MSSRPSRSSATGAAPRRSSFLESVLGVEDEPAFAPPSATTPRSTRAPKTKGSDTVSSPKKGAGVKRAESKAPPAGEGDLVRGTGSSKRQRIETPTKAGHTKAPFLAKKDTPAAPSSRHVPMQLEETVEVTNLPFNLRAIYGSTLHHHVDPGIGKHLAYPHVDQTAEDATLSLDVPHVGVAMSMKRRLHNKVIFGKQWKVEVFPKSAVTCAPTPTLVDVYLSIPLPEVAVEATFSSLPGFLALVRADNTNLVVNDDATAADAEGNDVKKGKKKRVGGTAAAAEEQPDSCAKYCATFADEGCALHARAVLSGRRQEGAHLYLVRRPPPVVTSGKR